MDLKRKGRPKKTSKRADHAIRRMVLSHSVKMAFLNKGLYYLSFSIYIILNAFMQACLYNVNYLALYKHAS